MGKTKRYKGKFLAFHQARKITRKLGLKSKREWELLKDRPKNIPFNPHVPYKEYGWTNPWQDKNGWNVLFGLYNMMIWTFKFLLLRNLIPMYMAVFLMVIDA